ncbi:MAG: hypothetical protein HOE90_11895 [Bacteriovoracaceae bacterium]|jgi:hypothetical protein|nr:hypothetical protein [Bacteriovoracaceae bacterium]
MEQNYWRKCGVCKKEIGFNGVYQKCSVSTCRKHVFCSVTCWDVHLGVENHRTAWAEEEKAPALAQNDKPRRRIVSTPSSSAGPSAASTGGSGSNSSDYPVDVLIVASKLKAYVKARADMNTSGNVLEKLSELVRGLADGAIDRARADGRKTIMDRDF